MPSQAVLNAYSSVIPGLETLISEYNNATETAQEEIAMKINDKIDTEEAGGEVLLQVQVRGVQINPTFSLKRVQVTSQKEEIYDVGDTVNFAMEFTENVYGNNTHGQVTSANAPEVTVGFGGTTANNPVAKVASLMQTNLKLSEGENLATFVSVSGNKINYSYTLKSGDRGTFRIASVTGKVYNSDGKEINFTTVQSVPEVIGGTITTEAPVVNPINNPTVTPIPIAVTPQITVGGQTVTLTKENVADYYGKVVTNYSATSSATWRLFYVDFDGDFGDEGKIYLKADQVSTTALNINSAALIDSVDAFAKMKQLNPQWRDNDGIVNEDNEKGVLWLCDKENTAWKQYCNNSKADWVIGAPSVEMFVKSYNQYHTRKGTSGYEKITCDFFDSTQNVAVNGYQYLIGEANNNYVYWTTNGTLKGDSNNMYARSGEYWWVASPSAMEASRVCDVNGVIYGLGTYYYSTVYGLCPLVSLKSGFQPELAN